MTWIIRDGRLVERGSAEEIATRYRPQPAGLPCPMLIRDQLAPVKSMHDGKIYESRSALYRSYREAGVRIIEKGEPQLARNAISDVKRAEVREALRRVRQGYKPRVSHDDLPAEDNVVLK
jgi:hypothetical protein